MDNNQQSQQSVQQMQQPPADQSIQQQPVQQAPQNTELSSVDVSNDHSHMGLYTTIALLLGATAILVGVVIVMMTKNKNNSVIPIQQSAQVTPVVSPAPGNTVAQQVQSVTPQPINNKQGLDTALQTLDNTDTGQITTGLNQNTQDTAGFSQ